jgi:hypothetical protein
MIPSTLWQTAKTESSLREKNVKRLVKSWINPTLDIFFMDDTACEGFIRENFNEVVYNTYKALPLGVMRADMWRICVLYINGGIYSDIDVFCKKDIKHILLDNDIVFLQEDHDADRVSNFFIASVPKHPVLKQIIDTMVKDFYITFDVKSDYLVQNFGMHCVQKVISDNHIQLVPKSIWSEYLDHKCHGSWRKSELDYRETINMKPITFFTTFHQAGYELYGKSWIRSFIENVAPRGAHIRAIIYADSLKETIEQHPQITVLDFKDSIPEHAEWKEIVFTESRNKFSRYVYDNTIRFSHKAFVIQHALETIKSGYAIWLDGDCIMHEASYENFPQSILPEESVVACQLEHCGNNNHHIESGFLAFDVETDDIEKFKTSFKQNYSVEKIIEMTEPYDGFVIYKSIKDSKVKWFNLNETYGIGGIQSDPSLTFMHPEIKNRFTHNIGLTGKTQYSSWDVVKHNDKIYSQLALVSVLNEKQLKIIKLLKKKSRLKSIS